VITTDGDPVTPFGHRLTPDQALFSIAEKLYEPLRVATDHGVKILLEPHGPVTGSIDKLEKLLEICDSQALALNLDTGNLWLAGDEPVDMVRRLGSLVEHVHWKDVPEEMAPERGTRFGFGMSTIPLGTGLVDIAGTVAALAKVGFDGDTTLEIAGDEAVLASRDFLESLAPAAVA
jgi:inosose dehydratase